MNHYGNTRFCLHCQKPRKADGFRPLPGVRARREVCEECYEAVMAKRVMVGDIPASDIPF